MEYDSLEVSAARMSDKIFDSLWRLRWEQPHMNVTYCRVDGGRIG